MVCPVPFLHKCDIRGESATDNTLVLVEMTIERKRGKDREGNGISSKRDHLINSRFLILKQLGISLGCNCSRLSRVTIKDLGAKLAKKFLKTKEKKPEIPVALILGPDEYKDWVDSRPLIAASVVINKVRSLSILQYRFILIHIDWQSADPVDKDGIVFMSPRRQLEGFDFLDIYSQSMAKAVRYWLGDRYPELLEYQCYNGLWRWFWRADVNVTSS
jgi:hypothetical protein